MSDDTQYLDPQRLQRPPGTIAEWCVVVVSLATLIFAIFANAIQLDLTNASLELTREQLKATQDQIELGREQLQASKVESDRSYRLAYAAFEQSRQHFLQAREPKLVFEREGFVYVVPTATGFGLKEPGRSGERHRDAPKLENHGEKSALNVRFRFKFEIKSTATLTEIIAPHEELYEPRDRNIEVGGDGTPVVWIPSLIENDSSRSIRELKGTVQVLFNDLNQSSTCDEMQFTLTTHYSAVIPFVRYEFNNWKGGACTVITEPYYGQDGGAGRPRTYKSEEQYAPPEPTLADPK